MPPSTDAEEDPGEALSLLPEALTHNLELAATILMAIAAVLTAWTAFQSSKWSGRSVYLLVRPDPYEEAGGSASDA